jgi:hypothetical protein
MVTATVSGSFHRHMHAISLAVQELTDCGVNVLSPADPRVVDSFGDFLFVASDRVRSIRMVQDRHIESIRASSFLWLIAPDGYVGQSAAMEMGFAVANQVPIFSTCLPFDLTLRQYVRLTSNLAEALTLLEGRSLRRANGFLISPHDNIEAVRVSLDRIEKGLRIAETGRSRDGSPEIYSGCKAATRALMLP